MLARMPALICLLRAVNVVGKRVVKMDALRSMCESLGMRDVQTLLQSGNVVCRTPERTLSDAKLKAMAKRIDDAAEAKFGFRTDVVLRTTAEMRRVVEQNPFGKRKDVPGDKLLVTFMPTEITAEARAKIATLTRDGEEYFVFPREVYVYFPNGMGRSKFAASLCKTLRNVGTVRNWNTTTKLLTMAEALEGRADAVGRG
jgi:uncharacterized protein (DUF1697 family)